MWKVVDERKPAARLAHCSEERMRLNEIPQSLRKELRKRRVKIKDVAKRLGSTPAIFYSQLTARERMSIALADRIAAELGITLEARLVIEESGPVRHVPAGLRRYTDLLLWLEADVEISFQLGGPDESASPPSRKPLHVSFSTLERVASALGGRWEVRNLGVDLEPEPNEIAAPAETAPAEDSNCTAPTSDSGLEEAFHGLWRHIWRQWVFHREALE